MTQRDRKPSAHLGEMEDKRSRSQMGGDGERAAAGEAERAAAEREARELVNAVNRLSDDAVYIASRDWFGTVMMGKPILAAAQNARQEAAFAQLLDAGFVHGDVERGTYGYRSTFRGRQAHPYCVEALSRSRAE